jgi:hypothetical protein
MPAKIQRNLGLIGTSAKIANDTSSGVSDTTSQRYYLKTQPSTEVYGTVGAIAHSTHSSLSVSGTLNLGTAHSDREIYIVIPSMAGNPSDTTDFVEGLTIGGVTLSNSTDNIFEVNPTVTGGNECGISFWRYVDNGSLGTSAAYTITFGGNQTHSAVIAFATGSTKSANDDTYGVSSTANWGSAGSVNTSNGGFVLYASIGQNSSTPTSSSIPNYTMGISFDTGTNEHVAVAFQEETTLGSVTVPQPTYTTKKQMAT